MIRSLPRVFLYAVIPTFLIGGLVLLGSMLPLASSWYGDEIYGLYNWLPDFGGVPTSVIGSIVATITVLLTIFVAFAGWRDGAPGRADAAKAKAAKRHAAEHAALERRMAPEMRKWGEWLTSVGATEFVPDVEKIIRLGCSPSDRVAGDTVVRIRRILRWLIASAEILAKDPATDNGRSRLFYAEAIAFARESREWTPFSECFSGSWEVIAPMIDAEFTPEFCKDHAGDGGFHRLTDKLVHQSWPPATASGATPASVTAGP